MIKCDKGKVEIEGMKVLVLAELTTLLHVLYKHVMIDDKGIDPEKAKADIMKAVERAFVEEDEHKEVAKNELKEVLSEFSDLLKNILSGKDDE